MPERASASRAAAITVWRITTARFIDSAFTGEGARRYGGRWNPKGVAMVYTAASQSLALLELLVQDDPLRASYVAIAAELPADLAVERVAISALPADWREAAAREALQAIGADWIARSRSAALAVPSAVVPTELNYLLNPQHPDFARVALGAPQAFVTDPRLGRKLAPLPRR